MNLCNYLNLKGGKLCREEMEQDLMVVGPWVEGNSRVVEKEGWEGVVLEQVLPGSAFVQTAVLKFLTRQVFPVMRQHAPSVLREW